jgi:deoxyribonuclease V
MPGISHRWDLAPEEAAAVQRDLAARVERQNRLGPLKHVAGVDVSVRDDVGQAAVVVLDLASLSPVEYAVATRPITFPYIPGLLSFREGPVVLDALARLKTTPDLLMVDGHGVAHPRRIGIASHLGLLADLPSIGCAKSRLVGRHDEPGEEAGSYAPLTDRGEVIGAVLRTRRGVNPMYISIGHRIDLATSIQTVLACCRGYRLPETTRWAHRVAGGERPPIGGESGAGATQPTLFDL